MGVVCLEIYFNVFFHSYSRLLFRLSAFQMERAIFFSFWSRNDDLPSKRQKRESPSRESSRATSPERQPPQALSHRPRQAEERRFRPPVLLQRIPMSLSSIKSEPSTDDLKPAVVERSSLAKRKKEKYFSFPCRFFFSFFPFLFLIPLFPFLFFPLFFCFFFFSFFLWLLNMFALNWHGYVQETLRRRRVWRILLRLKMFQMC